MRFRVDSTQEPNLSTPARYLRTSLSVLHCSPECQLAPLPSRRGTLVPVLPKRHTPCVRACVCDYFGPTESGCCGDVRPAGDDRHRGELLPGESAKPRPPSCLYIYIFAWFEVVLLVFTCYITCCTSRVFSYHRYILYVST